MTAESTFTFRLNWKISLLSLLLLPVLIGLGYWQLLRAKEKQTIQENWQYQQALPTLAYRDQHQLQEGRRITVTGEFNLHHYWLLENRIFDGALGYEVLMVLTLEPGKRLLVNRGWVAADQYREIDPEVITSEGPLRLTGTLKTPSDLRFVNQANVDSVSWPARLLEIDVALMEQQLEHSMRDQVVLLDADSPGALAINWQPINIMPSTHKGYAVQWFSMALALVVLWLFSNSNLGALLRQRFPGTQAGSA